MTHVTSRAATRPDVALIAGNPDPIPAALGIDQDRLQNAIARRRAQITRIEAEWVATCERRAAHGAGNHIRIDDRATWDRAMWNRYLAAAANTQAAYLPRLVRLYDEIVRLERLLTQPSRTFVKAI
jgi:hypothetical protein